MHQNPVQYLYFIAKWGVKALLFQKRQKKSVQGLLFSFFFMGFLPELMAEAPQKPSFQKPLPGEMVYGSASAPVTVYSYTSLDCGHCNIFHTQDLPKLQNEYTSKGKVRLIMRQFPISRRAVQATALLIQAPDLKKNQLIHRFYDRQAQWMTAKDPIPIFAEITEMPVDACRQFCENKQNMRPALQARLLAEKQAPIDGTPYFIINGRIINQYIEWDAFKKYLGS